jgi:fatty-acyl-CoA synthase
MIQPTPTGDDKLARRYSDFPTLVDALEYAAQGCRGLNFYSSKGVLKSALTFKELRDRAEDIGRRIVALGFKKGDRFALIAETSDDFAAFFLGCQYASVLPVPLPLPTSFGGREGFVDQLTGQMKSCHASAALTPEHMQELVQEATESFEDLIFIGTPTEFFEKASELGETRLPEQDDLAYLQYSSGSTRFPHGVSVTHRSLMANCHGMGLNGVHAQDGDRCCSWLPMYHDMGLVGMFLTPLTCQISADYLATEDFARRPLMWLTLMSRNKATVTYGPTFGYDICTRRAGSGALAALDLSSVRVAGIGGDMIRIDVMKRFSEKFKEVGFNPSAYMPSYGLAECTLAVSFMPPGAGIIVDKVDERVLSGELPAGQPSASSIYTHSTGIGENRKPIRYRDVVNCGVPLPNYEIEIRDEDETKLAEHNIGTVFVRGASVMRDYYGDPEATARVLSDDGWLDTGDMGYMHTGSLYIVGRAKDLIIVNGRNHWPQDIEWAVEQLPGMRSGDIAAISIPGDDNEEVPAVLVHCRMRDPEDRKIFAEDIKTQILKSAGIQCHIELIAPRSLPRTSSGKLSRAKARAQYMSGGLTILA